MAAGRKAGIDPDELGDKTLNDISAADFLSALNAGSATGMQAIHHWPEKKKYELLIEPENYGGFKVVDFIDRINEKKKFEIEKPPKLEYAIPKRVGEFEWWERPDPLHDPDFIREIAREVATQLRGMR